MKSIFYQTPYGLYLLKSIEDIDDVIIQNKFTSPFKGIIDPNEKEKECRDLMNDFKKMEFVGKGSLGEVRLYQPGIVIKVENCESFFGIWNRERTDFPEYFIEKESKKMEILKPIWEEGITPEIFEVESCDKRCITFMEKI